MKIMLQKSTHNQSQTVRFFRKEKMTSHRFFLFVFLLFSYSLQANSDPSFSVSDESKVSIDDFNEAFLVRAMVASLESEDICTDYTLEKKVLSAVVNKPQEYPTTTSMRMGEEKTCRRVSSCDGDAEQTLDGTNLVICDADDALTDLEIGELFGLSNQIAISFEGWNIPSGATIISASLQFTAISNSSSVANFSIYGEDTDNAPAYTTGYDVISRPLTTASVAWSPQDWVMGDSGVDQQTPDLTAIVQEIVDRPGYIIGNKLAFHIAGSGGRNAYSFDISNTSAPQLCVVYEAAPEEPPIECTTCPIVNLASLDGVPNFPTVDLLNICSAPDTASLLIYNPAECELTNIDLEILFDDGLFYGGFIFSDPNSSSSGIVGVSDLSDLSRPRFSVSEIGSGETMIINFAIKADCGIDSQSEEDINFDANLSYSYAGASASEICTQESTEIGAYNSSIKEPVINVLSVEPPELEITQSSTPQCQTITVSQDGIGAFLDKFQFSIQGLDQSSYTLTSMAINGTTVPPANYSYNAATQVINTTITGDYFAANFHTGANGDMMFDTDERLTIEICYTVGGCIEETGFLIYQAFYGCNGEVCGDVSEMQGAVVFEPDYGATPVALSSMINYGGICGDNLSYEIEVFSENTNPLDGLWQDLVFKYKGCILQNTSIVNINMNGILVPANLWAVADGTVTIDLSTNTADFDGVGGIEDSDSDGFFDDLPGGESIVIYTELDISCATESAECSSLACNLSQLEVNGIRNCGQGFQEFATIEGDGPVNFYYGEISSMANTTVVNGHDIPITEEFVTQDGIWLTSGVPFIYEYEFGSDNIEFCDSPGGISMVVTILALGNRINNIRYKDLSASYLGSPVGGVTGDWVTGFAADGVTVDTFAYEITIPAGDPTATNHDYSFELEYRGDCFPDDYAFLTYKILEECNSCSATGPCQIVRSCGEAVVYVEWNGSNCVCVVEGVTGEYYRTNYGFADKAMTIPLTRDDVPRADQLRFLPGDTLFRSTEFTINDIDEVKKADNSWIMTFDVNRLSPAAPLIADIDEANFLGWFWFDSATGIKTEIGVPDCMQNYPHSTRDNIFYPSIRLENLGARNFSKKYRDIAPGGAINDYGICDNDNINPNYPSDIVYYDIINASAFDDRTDLARMSIYWQRPASCPETDNINTNNNSITATGTSQDHDNPCFEEFWQQFPMKNGDKIIVEYETPLIHNPAYDLQQLNGTSLPETPRLYIDFVGRGSIESTCGDVVIFADCSRTAPIQEHIPGPVTFSNSVNVTDCLTEVNYEFTLDNPVPTSLGIGELAWFENEYRPFMVTEYLEFQFPTNMIYQNNGVIIMLDGTEVPFPVGYIDEEQGNVNCISDGLGGICCVAVDTSELAAVRLVSNQYNEGRSLQYGFGPDGDNETGQYCDVPNLVHKKGDIFPQLMVGGLETCTFGIRYNLSSLCPEDIESTDFALEYQFAEPYIPTMAFQRSGSYFGNTSTGSTDHSGSSYYYLFPDNPFGENCSTDPTLGCQYYFQKITTDPIASDYTVNPMRIGGRLVTTPNNVGDNSNDFPPLIPSLANLLEADLAGASEFNTYTVCAGTVGGTETHTNVVTSIDVPNTIDFIGVEDGVGMPITWVLTQTLPDRKVYAITLPDLAPGDCAEIVIETELLFCPVGLDVDTKICVGTVSGCIALEKAAALSAAGGACDLVNACYEYIAEEADIQAEWDPQPQGPYSLCEVIPVGIRIKNVKPSVLTHIEQDFWLPDGLNFVTGSFQVCYPGGPTTTGPSNNGVCVDIPDPLPNSVMDNIFGTHYEYTEDAIWSTYIDQNGLAGILSTSDSNRVQIVFEVETVCDEFVSGTSIYYQASAADPCESRVNSMFVNSAPIVIEGALPSDFAQFFVIADPTEANCGENATLNLTYLNVSPIGESIMSTACLELETSTFNYTSGSATWISPNTHNPNVTEEINGALTKICFTIPDGIASGEAFVMSLDYVVPDDISCGLQSIGVQVSSEIIDVTCIEDGSECSVNVLNSVNPTIDIEFLPPLDVLNQNLISRCPDLDGSMDICYTVDLNNNGDPYSNDVSISVYRDLNLDGMIDTSFEPLIGTETQSITLSTNENGILTGCFTVQEGESCPVILRIEQTSSCVCNLLDYPYSSIEPDVLQGMEDEVTLCPGVPLALENCGSWDYSSSPSNGATFTPNIAGDSIYVYVNSGFGVTSPVTVTISSTVGGCAASEVEFSLYSLESFQFGPYTSVDACNVGCTNLSLGLPSDYESSVSALWTPATYLDDPTSLTPMICDPQSDITYAVELIFTSGNNVCTFNADYPVNVVDQPIENIVAGGDLCPGVSSTITAPGGYATYEWMLVNGDGTTTTVGLSGSNIFMPTSTGSYVVEYSNLGDICTTRSNVFEVSVCIDYGDLPDNGSGTGMENYETNVANNGAGHEITDGLSLGGVVDEETDGQPDVTATGDGSDEDGIMFPPNLQWTPGGTVVIPFSITNDTGIQAELEIWIDWNGDGDFDDPNEFVFDLSDDLTGDFGLGGNLVINIPADIATDQPLGIRARLSNEDDMTPYGLVSSGEVEDYLITINCTIFQCMPATIQINR